jgi:hypothetical protein
VATFGGVGPGDHRLTRVEFPVGGGALILACQSNRRDIGSYPFAPFALVPADGSVRVSLIAGETLVCDWYEAPAEEQGLTVRVYECGSSEPSVEACDAAAEGVRFVLVPVTGEGDPITFDTDETGTAHLMGLDGTYTLSQVGRQPCALESLDLDAEGNLTLDAESETVVRVFNCA